MRDGGREQERVGAHWGSSRPCLRALTLPLPLRGPTNHEAPPTVSPVARTFVLPRWWRLEVRGVCVCVWGGNEWTKRTTTLAEWGKQGWRNNVENRKSGWRQVHRRQPRKAGHLPTPRYALLCKKWEEKGGEYFSVFLQVVSANCVNIRKPRSSGGPLERWEETKNLGLIPKDGRFSASYPQNWMTTLSKSAEWTLVLPKITQIDALHTVFTYCDTLEDSWTVNTFMIDSAHPLWHFFIHIFGLILAVPYWVKFESYYNFLFNQIYPVNR